MRDIIHQAQDAFDDIDFEDDTTRLIAAGVAVVIGAVAIAAVVAAFSARRPRQLNAAYPVR